MNNNQLQPQDTWIAMVIFKQLRCGRLATIMDLIQSVVALILLIVPVRNVTILSLFSRLGIDMAPRDFQRRRMVVSSSSSKEEREEARSDGRSREIQMDEMESVLPFDFSISRTASHEASSQSSWPIAGTSSQQQEVSGIPNHILLVLSVEVRALALPLPTPPARRCWTTLC